MTILKCKMCGGDIQISEDQFIGTCDSCGSTMTLPRVPDEQRANFFNRANHFRRQGEFDKAIAAYESILNQDDRDAEAHWGVVLSRYGIEYVEDPVSHERVPTCHRVQMASILMDADYLAALEHAPDSYSRGLYKDEAQKIADIQKGILALSAQEQPYDVFICYKETSEAGTRTPDSALAQDVYYQLTQAGYKVFFSRITLEDKLGQQYEPYIFAALNSAKVMVVIGTQPEYFNAVWVKNEWSRFLALMKKDRSKLLIPCYRGMDAYDLPEALSMLQSQDMGKIGFIQDLVRGIKKVVSKESGLSYIIAPGTQTTNGVPQTSPLLRRAEIFLEDGEWEKADELYEQVLMIEPENGHAYLGKSFVKLKAFKDDDIEHIEFDLLTLPEFRRALQFLPEDARNKYLAFAENCKKNEAEKIEKERWNAEQINHLNELKESLQDQTINHQILSGKLKQAKKIKIGSYFWLVAFTLMQFFFIQFIFSSLRGRSFVFLDAVAIALALSPLVIVGYILRKEYLRHMAIKEIEEAIRKNKLEFQSMKEKFDEAVKAAKDLH